MAFAEYPARCAKAREETVKRPSEPGAAVALLMVRAPCLAGTSARQRFRQVDSPAAHAAAF